MKMRLMLKDQCQLALWLVLAGGTTAAALGLVLGQAFALGDRQIPLTMLLLYAGSVGLSLLSAFLTMASLTMGFQYGAARRTMYWVSMLTFGLIGGVTTAVLAVVEQLAPWLLGRPWHLLPAYGGKVGGSTLAGWLAARGLEWLGVTCFCVIVAALLLAVVKLPPRLRSVVPLAVLFAWMILMFGGLGLMLWFDRLDLIETAGQVLLGLPAAPGRLALWLALILGLASLGLARLFRRSHQLQLR